MSWFSCVLQDVTKVLFLKVSCHFLHDVAIFTNVVLTTTAFVMRIIVFINIYDERDRSNECLHQGPVLIAVSRNLPFTAKYHEIGQYPRNTENKILKINFLPQNC